MKFNTISVIGLGYIGLPTAVAFANSGKRVLGVDINEKLINSINRGETHIDEPDLDQALWYAIRHKRLSASLTVTSADVFIIAVPTPLKEGNQPDLSHIEAAVHSIAPVLSKGNLVILESTSPVGTTEKMARRLAELRPDLQFPLHNPSQADVQIAYCPERVLPGKIMRELVHCDRIIGGLSADCTESAVNLYRVFVQGECIRTDARTAEMCKLTENSFRDVNIAFANELSLICEQLGINVWELIALANRHPRVNILQPGAGVGGHCIAVDPWFIVAQTPQLSPLIRTARQVNDSKPYWVIEKVKATLADCVTAKKVKAEDITIACLGLAFKADVGDLRESPALFITQQLADWHAGKLLAVEPNISLLPQELCSKADLVSLQRALQQADILVLLTDHREFSDCSIDAITQPWIVDTRGVWKQ